MSRDALQRCRGRFRVARLLLETCVAGEGANLFAGMVVLDVKHAWNADESHYLAIHPDFRPVETAAATPEYRPVFHPGQSTPEWRELPPEQWSACP